VSPGSGFTDNATLAQWQTFVGAYPTFERVGGPAIASDTIVRIGGTLVVPDRLGGVTSVPLTSVCAGRRTYDGRITLSLQVKWLTGSLVLDNGVFYAEGFDDMRNIVVDGNRR
jgi:hypothetical protein